MVANSLETTTQIASNIAQLWEAAYQRGDDAACAIIEVAHHHIEQMQQDVVVAQAERESLYIALTRLQDDKKKLAAQADTNYYEGFNSGVENERRKHGDPDETYNAGYEAGKSAAADEYETLLNQYRGRAMRKVGF